MKCASFFKTLIPFFKTLIPHCLKFHGKSIFPSSKMKGWWVDSGAACHVTYCKDGMANFTAIREKICMATCSYSSEVIGMGTVELPLPNGRTLTLTDVFYCPDIGVNLISVSMLDKIGFETNFKGGVVTLKQNDAVLANAILEGEAYKLVLSPDISSDCVTITTL
ncbi:hypothetical protein AMTRI_Chr02g211790 [Amborella trichopoda]